LVARVSIIITAYLEAAGGNIYVTIENYVPAVDNKVTWPGLIYIPVGSQIALLPCSVTGSKSLGINAISRNGIFKSQPPITRIAINVSYHITGQEYSSIASKVKVTGRGLGDMTVGIQSPKSGIEPLVATISSNIILKGYRIAGTKACRSEHITAQTYRGIAAESKVSCRCLGDTTIRIQRPGLSIKLLVTCITEAIGSYIIGKYQVAA
jgi:hypothetical protein